MISVRSDSSDRPVTVPNPVRALPKILTDLHFSVNSDRSDRNSQDQAPCAHKAFNLRNPCIGHCCHCTKIPTTAGGAL